MTGWQLLEDAPKRYEPVCTLHQEQLLLRSPAHTGHRFSYVRWRTVPDITRWYLYDLPVIGGALAEYRLLTIWRIEAPLDEVYAAIYNSLRWPDWWPGVQKVELVKVGDADGINSVSRYYWRGKLPYRVVFEVCATRIEKLVAIEGATRGDLEGIGRWRFSRQGAVSIVHCEWHVRSTRWWMNLIAPVARSMFIRNHGRVMLQGAEGLARLLDSPLVGQENIDLMAETVPPRAAHRR